MNQKLDTIRGIFYLKKVKYNHGSKESNETMIVNN